MLVVGDLVIADDLLHRLVTAVEISDLGGAPVEAGVEGDAHAARLTGQLVGRGLEPHLCPVGDGLQRGAGGGIDQCGARRGGRLIPRGLHGDLRISGLHAHGHWVGQPESLGVEGRGRDGLGHRDLVALEEVAVRGGVGPGLHRGDAWDQSVRIGDPLAVLHIGEVGEMGAVIHVGHELQHVVLLHGVQSGQVGIELGMFQLVGQVGELRSGAPQRPQLRPRGRRPVELGAQQGPAVLVDDVLHAQGGVTGAVDHVGNRGDVHAEGVGSRR